MGILAAAAAALLAIVVLRVLASRSETSSLPGAAAQAGGPPTEDSIREMLLRGRKIDAIKAYRLLHGTDLKDSKQAVERMATALPPAP